MISEEVRKKYIPAIGIECHTQLKTRTKLFAAVGNDARHAQPNTLISHICLGMPGALPVLNEQAVNYAMKVAFALGTEPQAYSIFERKHYFYPDLPKGYQITQLNQPIISGGFVEINSKEQKRKVRINRVQLEEDAGKNTHPPAADYSLVDLNRAGTPLLEIVSEADMRSAEEAKAYARELYLLIRYTNVSDADMFQGNMRFDVNVSVSTDPSKLGTRTETKNLNSFKSVEKAVEYEIYRQIELLEKGQPIIQETRGWDDSKQRTISQRGKEEAHDYRYFPDPDLPPIVLGNSEIESVKQSMPVMPGEWRERLQSLGLGKSQTETLLDAELENEDVSILPLIEQNLHNAELARFTANWCVNVMIPLLKSGNFKLNDADHQSLQIDIYNLTKDNKLSSTSAKAMFADIAASGNLPSDISVYAEEKGYIQVSDESAIAEITEKVIADNPKAADDVRNGEAKAIGYLVGQVMKLSQGKANPGLAQKLIKEKLEA